MSHSDIREETCLGLSRIKKAIKELENEGLIQTKRQGLGKPNLYSVDGEDVNQYIEEHESDYKIWREKIRQENSSETTVNSLIG
jgi:transposase